MLFINDVALTQRQTCPVVYFEMLSVIEMTKIS